MLRIVAQLLLATVGFGFAEPAAGVGFRFAIVPLGDSNSSVVCTFAADELKIERGEEVVVQKKPNKADMARLLEPFAAVKPEVWAGFHADPVALDGYLLAFSGTNAQGEVQFQGANGCPAGFVDVLAAINAVAGEKVFDCDLWRAQAEACRRFEDKGDLSANRKSMIAIAIEEHRAAAESEP